MTQADQLALKKIFDKQPRLVASIGNGTLPKWLKPFRHDRYIVVERFQPAPSDDLRADLIYLHDDVSLSDDLVSALETGSHDHGYICSVAALSKLTPRLKKLGFRSVGSSHMLWEKTPIDISEDYGDNYLARWGDNDFMANAKIAAKQIVDKFPALHKLSSIRVIDVGSLNGYIMESLYRAGVKNIFGTDISYPIAITHAINSYHLPATRIFDFTNNTYADESFDVTVCMEVLEHIPPEITDKFVVELARITTQDGRLLISASEDWYSDDTHINCRNRAEWFSIFAQHGLVPTGEQIIFPGFNNFVLKKAHGPWQLRAAQWLSSVRFKLKGTLPPRDKSRRRLTK